jgi:excisionase family DNA binding protein
VFNDYPDILNADELCELMGIGKNAIYKLLNSGEIESFKIGKTHKIPKQSVIDYIMRKCCKKV